ncbi:MAG: diphthine--ammonia ligase [Candidatus Bathyarchaeia archaeon]|jgi:ABC transporter with metal-binding/Fe-S-binding domain ATP-binding protein
MKVASLFSGGKDSAFALWCAQMQGWDVVTLVTVISESSESWMFHYPATEWTTLQSEAMRIPRTVIRTKGVKEEELSDLVAGLRGLIKTTGIEGIVSGAVASEYQRTRLDNVCEELGMRSFAPLWHKNQQQLVREQIESGFEIIITACNALGLTRSWLGRRLDIVNFQELVQLSQKYGLSVAFEGGEAETFVLGAPMFNGRIQVARSVPHWRNESGYLELEELRLIQ